MKNKFRLSVKLLLASFFLALFFVSCKKTEPIIIWTDRPEIVSYVEFFNVAQKKAKAIVVYKKNVAVSLPPAKDEKEPDIVIGSLLRNSRIKKNFIAIDRVFGRSRINPLSMYDTLLDYGKVNGKQYLIPVSFNLPTIIYSQKNNDLVSESTLIDCDTIRDRGALFNLRDKNEVYIKMGYAPSWDSEFIYEVAKAKGARFGEKGTVFSWNENSLETTIEYLKNWSFENNSGTGSEQDFSFKYLYSPDQKIVNSNRCLFACTTSDVFFDIPSQQTENIGFKWFSGDGKTFVNDEITSLGLYRTSSNVKAAISFIEWFFSESTQKNLLDRAMRMQLDTTTFGICNGFSSIISVNERVFPAYYKNLLGNLPSDSSLVAPLQLPTRWESLKERVILPYLLESCDTESNASVKSIEERLALWRNQFN